jgi:hypothetical protein
VAGGDEGAGEKIADLTAAAGEDDFHGVKLKGDNELPD